ncbi:hypothetical protein ACJX0J_037460 [Zea mays]
MIKSMYAQIIVSCIEMIKKIMTSVQNPQIRLKRLFLHKETASCWPVVLPVYDELNELFDIGMPTYDASRDEKNSKDNLQARKDLQEMNIRLDLHPQKRANDKDQLEKYLGELKGLEKLQAHRYLMLKRSQQTIMDFHQCPLHIASRFSLCYSTTLGILLHQWQQ